jgi:cell division inhibitor SulA
LGDTLVGMDHEMAVRIAAQRLRALDALRASERQALVRAARDANAAGYSVRTVASWAGVAHQVLGRSMRR